MVYRIFSVGTARCRDIAFCQTNKINPERTKQNCYFSVRLGAPPVPRFSSGRVVSESLTFASLGNVPQNEMGVGSLFCVTVAYLYVIFSAHIHTTGVNFI